MTAWNGFLLLCWVWAAVTVWYVVLVVSEVVVYRRRAGKTAAAEDDVFALAASLDAPVQVRAVK